MKTNSIIDYVNTIEDSKKRQIMLDRFAGKTLEEIAVRYNLTKERIRQIYHKTLQEARLKNKPFYEDKYMDFFQHYKISKDNFTLVFNEPSSTYEYLKAITPKNPSKKRFKFALEDENIPLDMQENLKKIVQKKYILLNGKCISNNWASLVDYYIERYCINLTKYEDFMRDYRDFLKTLDPCKRDIFEINKRTCNTRLANSMCVLWSQWQQFRYYDIQSRDYNNLLEKINLLQYDGLEISTLKIFRENPELMEQYDIHDEYELHNLLKKISDKLDDKIKFIRMPTIEIRDVNRDAQIWSLLVQNVPISAKDFSLLYEKKYGVKAQSVIANYLTKFLEYCNNGMFYIDANEIQMKLQRYK